MIATGVIAPFKAHIEIAAADHARLDADVTIPGDAAGVVVFAHGGGSSRSPRSCSVACELNSVRLATVTAGLLTSREEGSTPKTRSLWFDIPLLTQRLITVIDWARLHPPFHSMPMGLFRRLNRCGSERRKGSATSTGGSSTLPQPRITSREPTNGARPMRFGTCGTNTGNATW